MAYIHSRKYFNLWTEPLIPIEPQTPDDPSHISIKDLLSSRFPEANLLLSDPILKAALYRFLISLVARQLIHTPLEPEEAAKRYIEGALFTPEELAVGFPHDYIDQFFWLFHPQQPFFQNTSPLRDLPLEDEKAMASMRHSAATLFPAIPAKSENVWWTHPLKIDGFTYPEITLGLLARGFYATQGNVSVIHLENGTKNKFSTGGAFLETVPPISQFFWEPPSLTRSLWANITNNLIESSGNLFWTDPDQIPSPQDALLLYSYLGCNTLLLEPPVLVDGLVEEVIRTPSSHPKTRNEDLVKLAREKDIHSVRFIQENKPPRTLRLSIEKSFFRNLFDLYRNDITRQTVLLTAPSVLKPVDRLIPSLKCSLSAFLVSKAGNATGVKIEHSQWVAFSDAYVDFGSLRQIYVEEILDYIFNDTSGVVKELRSAVTRGFTELRQSDGKPHPTVSVIRDTSELLFLSQVNLLIENAATFFGTPKQKDDEVLRGSFIQAAISTYDTITKPYIPNLTLQPDLLRQRFWLDWRLNHKKETQ